LPETAMPSAHHAAGIATIVRTSSRVIPVCTVALILMRAGPRPPASHEFLMSGGLQSKLVMNEY
jgi:hypothetical protein